MKKDKQKIENENISKIYTVKTIHTGSLKYKDILNDMLNNSPKSNYEDQMC